MPAPAVVTLTQSPLPDMDNIWDRLRTLGFPIPNDVAFSDFAQADKEATVMASLTDGEIIQSVTTNNVLQAMQVELTAGASLYTSFSNDPGCWRHVS